MFGRCLSELAQMVPFSYSWGISTHCSDRLHDFPVNIPRCYKNDYVNNFFSHTARLHNFLPIECFSLTFNLNGFKSRIKRRLLSVSSFQKHYLHTLIYLYALISLCSFFLKLYALKWLFSLVQSVLQFQKNDALTHFSHFLAPYIYSRSEN